MDSQFQDPIDLDVVVEEFGVMGQVFSEFAEQKELIKRLPRRPFERNRILEALDEAFELIGGVPRLSIWAHRNPSKFYPLWLKAAGQKVEVNHSGEVIIRPAIPRSPLDGTCTEVSPSATQLIDNG
jgi:hypothetical protein